LGAIESACRFEFAKNIRHAVVADAIAGTEIGVGVVVEGAPTDAAGVLRIGGELIVNTRVTQGMFALALIVVGGLSGKSVPDKLGVQVARMIRRFEWNAEVVHGENVFEEFR